MPDKQFILCGFYLVLFISALYPLRNYDGAAHSRAIKKALFLIFFAATPAVLGFIVSIGTPLVIYGELFIYAASFLPPVLYTYYERANDERPNKRALKGDWFTFFYSLAIFVATAFMFGLYKANPDSTISSYPYAPSIILLLTIILWYSTIASEEQGRRFVSHARQEEKTFIEKVTSRNSVR